MLSKDEEIEELRRQLAVKSEELELKSEELALKEEENIELQKHALLLKLVSSGVSCCDENIDKFLSIVQLVPVSFEALQDVVNKYKSVVNTRTSEEYYSSVQSSIDSVDHIHSSGFRCDASNSFVVKIWKVDFEYLFIHSSKKYGADFEVFLDKQISILNEIRRFFLYHFTETSHPTSEHKYFQPFFKMFLLHFLQELSKISQGYTDIAIIPINSKTNAVEAWQAIFELKSAFGSLRLSASSKSKDQLYAEVLMVSNKKQKNFQEYNYFGDSNEMGHVGLDIASPFKVEKSGGNINLNLSDISHIAETDQNFNPKVETGPQINSIGFLTDLFSMHALLYVASSNECFRTRHVLDAREYLLTLMLSTMDFADTELLSDLLDESRRNPEIVKPSGEEKDKDKLHPMTTRSMIGKSNSKQEMNYTNIKTHGHCINYDDDEDNIDQFMTFNKSYLCKENLENLENQLLNRINDFDVFD